MFLSQKHIPRRMFLRGMGVTLALPLLDAMVPALKAQAPSRPRVAFVYIPHGASMPYWTPLARGAGLDFAPEIFENPQLQFDRASEGADFQLSEILTPLEAFRSRMTIVSGLAHRMADAQPGEKGGDHATPAAVFLSGAHPRMTTGQDVRLGATVDQVMAKSIGQDTPLPSLELGIEDVGATGTCGSGYSCAYSNTISWETPTKPLPVEIRPRVVFDRLFGDGSTPEERLALKAQKRSILDSITHDVTRLRGLIGPSDRSRLDQYLDDIREIERRLEISQDQEEDVASPSVIGVPESFEEHADLMFDLMTLAFKSEITRISTIMLGRELSVRSFPESGHNGGWHGTSHHGQNPERMRNWAKVNKYHVGVLKTFLDRLQATPDGDGNLLDHSMILYGSGLSNGNQHNHYPLPALVLGGASGRLRGGRHLIADRTSMSNLLLSMLDVVGIDVGHFGDSTGKLDI